MFTSLDTDTDNNDIHDYYDVKWDVGSTYIMKRILNKNKGACDRFAQLVLEKKRRIKSYKVSADTFFESHSFKLIAKGGSFKIRALGV